MMEPIVHLQLTAREAVAAQMLCSQWLMDYGREGLERPTEQTLNSLLVKLSAAARVAQVKHMGPVA